MTYIQGIKYNLSEYNCRCPVCDKQSRNNKCFIDHIFHRHLKDDEEHAKFVREMTELYFIEKAKVICPVCNKKLLRSLGNHFRLLKDNKEHNRFLRTTPFIAIMRIWMDNRGIVPYSKMISYFKLKLVNDAVADQLGSLSGRSACVYVRNEYLRLLNNGRNKDVFINGDTQSDKEAAATELEELEELEA